MRGRRLSTLALVLSCWLGVMVLTGAQLDGTGRGTVAETKTLTGATRDTTVLVDAKRVMMIGNRAATIILCGQGMGGSASRDTLSPATAFRFNIGVYDVDTVMTVAGASGLIYHQVVGYDAVEEAGELYLYDFPASERMLDSLKLIHEALYDVGDSVKAHQTATVAGLFDVGDSVKAHQTATVAGLFDVGDSVKAQTPFFYDIGDSVIRMGYDVGDTLKAHQTAMVAGLFDVGDSVKALQTAAVAGLFDVGDSLKLVGWDIGDSVKAHQTATVAGLFDVGDSVKAHQTATVAGLFDVADSLIRVGYDVGDTLRAIQTTLTTSCFDIGDSVKANQTATVTGLFDVGDSVKAAQTALVASAFDIADTLVRVGYDIGDTLRVVQTSIVASGFDVGDSVKAAQTALVASAFDVGDSVKALQTAAVAGLFDVGDSVKATQTAVEVVGDTLHATHDTIAAAWAVLADLKAQQVSTRWASGSMTLGAAATETITELAGLRWYTISSSEAVTCVIYGDSVGVAGVDTFIVRANGSDTEDVPASDSIRVEAPAEGATVDWRVRR